MKKVIDITLRCVVETDLGGVDDITQNLNLDVKSESENVILCDSEIIMINRLF